MTGADIQPSAGGTLFIVSTPIGNLEDVTLRAIRVLREVDCILAEDTRVTGRLLKHLEISSRMMSYHSHNERGRIPRVLDMLRDGQQIAMVSDAGTPGISDPAHKLVKAVIQGGYPIVPVPGATALIPALVTSGLPTDRFLFTGFLPRKKGRQTAFLKLAEEPGTIILYESPHRVYKTLQDIVKHFGNRYIVISREITKRYEEFIRGNAETVLGELEGRSLKGEIVLLIAGKDFKPIDSNDKSN